MFVGAVESLARLCVNGGNGIIDLLIEGTLSGSSIVVLNNETYYNNGTNAIADNSCLGTTELGVIIQDCAVKQSGEYFVKLRLQRQLPRRSCKLLQMSLPITCNPCVTNMPLP